jgi:cytochrome b6-f complex iron-sulfur subunit
MRIDSTVTRRSVLAAGAAGAGAVALAACSSSSSNNASSSTPNTTSSASSPASTTSPASSPSSPSAASPSSAANPPLAKLADIQVGMSTSANLPDGKPAIVSRPTATTAVAFSAKCTHMGCTVQPAGSELHCPCHGSKYNALTGAVLQGPAPAPLPKIAVQVENGEVVLS